MLILQHIFFLFQPAVSKSLSFREESLVITQIAEGDVAMDVTTTQIKEDRVRSTVEVLVRCFSFNLMNL